MAQYVYASDDPEFFHQGGIMLSGPISGSAPYRVYFDHVNSAQSPKQVVLQVRNDGPADVVLKYAGATGQSGDYMKAGHLATTGFLEARFAGQYEQVTVQAGGQHVIAAIPLALKDNACGMYDFLLTPPSTLKILVFACDTSADAATAATNLALLGEDIKRRKGLFDASDLSTPRQIDYIVGTQGSEFKFGDQILPNLMQGHPTPLGGEYGVVRAFECTLHNTDASDATVALYQRTAGGDATGTYLIDSVMTPIAKTASQSVHKLKRYVVPAGSAVATSIKAMSDLNSYTPMALRFAPDDPAIQDAVAF
jgi:hypothetical protein